MAVGAVGVNGAVGGRGVLGVKARQPYEFRTASSNVVLQKASGIPRCNPTISITLQAKERPEIVTFAVLS
jgi:hypothetical protein